MDFSSKSNATKLFLPVAITFIQFVSDQNQNYKLSANLIIIRKNPIWQNYFIFHVGFRPGTKRAQYYLQKWEKVNFSFKEGTPTIVKNYNPGSKIYIFDTVVKSQMPSVQIAFNQCQQKTFQLQNYLGHQAEPHVEIMQDIRILFTFELLANTEKLYGKYFNEKLQIEKHYLCQGIKDYIRSEQQFLAQYERDQQIEQIRQLQAEQSRIQRDLCEEIMNTKKYSISIGKILLIVVVFIFFGFLMGRNDSIKGNFITSLLYPEEKQRTKRQDEKVKKKKQKVHSKSKEKINTQKTLNKEKRTKTLKHSFK